MDWNTEHETRQGMNKDQPQTNRLDYPNMEQKAGKEKQQQHNSYISRPQDTLSNKNTTKEVRDRQPV